METKPTINAAVAAAAEYAGTLALNYDVLQSRNSPENVHEARIASRKLRISLRVLSRIDPGFAHEKFAKSLKTLGCLLGKIRQLDVQLIFLQAHSAKLDAQFIREIRARLRRERKDAYAAFSASDHRGFHAELRELKGRLRPSRIAVDSSSGKRVRKQLARYLHAFLSFDPREKDTLHALRISAKKLRYTLELLRPFYGRALDLPISCARKVQDVLGDVCEMDVWVAYFRDNDVSGNNHLYRTCLSKRKIALKEFQGTRAVQGKKRIWENLKKAL